ncbi:MAG TPA: PEP-CTERM sorting domain-containing protein [Flavisolibacter sp.]|nr:PEP-CTERM sorting domain-containing protein [Flavisolibacter sp.]
MLRHIISVSLASLAMTACASLIPVKANAATFASLILMPNQPLGTNTILRNPGDSLEFTLFLLIDKELRPRYSLEVRDYSITYDDTELSLVKVVNPMGFNQPFFTDSAVLATYIFQVLESVVKDGKSDISATASYQAQRHGFIYPESLSAGNDPYYDVQPVPEPLTIFGTATALGCGVFFKQKSSKKTVS